MQHLELFDRIASGYALFFGYQTKRYPVILEHLKALGFEQDAEVLDVGCGTGALTRLLSENYRTIGLDGSAKMLEHARRLNRGTDIGFIRADLRESLPFTDDRFDFTIASFVLHGLSRSERIHVLKELTRVSKSAVILHDYLGKRNPFIDLVEYLEGGDYFGFMETFNRDWKEAFKSQKTVTLSPATGLYIGFKEKESGPTLSDIPAK